MKTWMKKVLMVTIIAAPIVGEAATYSVSLRSQRGYYVSAEGGGGTGNMNANRPAIGAWETFGIQQH